MKRPFRFVQSSYPSSRSRAGYTMIEILMATALTLMMIAGVVEVFARIGDSVNKSRATLEMADRLRAATVTLQRDLEGITATLDPPLRPADDLGYFEIKEGPVGISLKEYGGIASTTPFISPLTLAVDSLADPLANAQPSGTNQPSDTTVGDFDDILMFTTRRSGQPFVGRYQEPADHQHADPRKSIESHVAEVAWFVRGHTLYRRVRLVAPTAEIELNLSAFYARNDIAAHYDSNLNTLVPSSLGDLTKRWNRFGHDPDPRPAAFPNGANWGGLGLPTLCECSSPAWNAGAETPVYHALEAMDFWSANPYPTAWGVNAETGTRNGLHGPRVAEDVILTNVIGFDVKVWDPGVQMYVDLGYNPDDVELTESAPNRRTSSGPFAGLGHPKSGLRASADPPSARVYCTWSDHYEYDGVSQNGSIIDPATNGFDDNGNGIVDEIDERETSPPYPAPLRGIQVKIRVFERDSRQIREMTVVQDFLPR